MDQAPTVGDRVRDVRKRRGLTQRALAEASGVSLSLVKKLEQGDYGDARLETLHRLASTLRIPTSSLTAGPDAEQPEREDVEQWAPVRQALEGTNLPEPDPEPTLEGVRHAIGAAVGALLASRYRDVRVMLPRLLRDADTLVVIAGNGDEREARRLRSLARQITAYMMGQTWQFTVANHAIELAADDASDELTAMAAADWKCWTLLRQGRLAETRELASRWADDTEPRMSRARSDELVAWGRFLILVSTAAVRDNRPGEARDALRLARVAATGVGKEVIPSFNPWQVFGPMTVSMVSAENAIIQDRPDITLAVGDQVAGRDFPLPRNWNRHRLDVAHAHASTRQYAEAVGVLCEVREAAPEWLAQQRYARDILRKIIGHRRTLTPEMRDLADFVHLAL
jgi:transcriptional regulator with XRE-family HTH domain